MCQRAARLHLEDAPETFHFDDAAHDPPIWNRPLPTFRLQIRFDVLAPPRGQVHAPGELDGIHVLSHVATDEPFSVFPRDAWDPFADRIHWLQQPPRYPDPVPWLYRGVHPFRFGLIWASVWDAPAPDVDRPVRRMQARRVLAMFLQGNPPELRSGRVGLRYSLLTGRRVTCERDLNDAANHHERWWLEELDR